MDGPDFWRSTTTKHRPSAPFFPAHGNAFSSFHGKSPDKIVEFLIIARWAERGKDLPLHYALRYTESMCAYVCASALFVSGFNFLLLTYVHYIVCVPEPQKNLLLKKFFLSILASVNCVPQYNIDNYVFCFSKFCSS